MTALAFDRLQSKDSNNNICYKNQHLYLYFTFSVLQIFEWLWANPL